MKIIVTGALGHIGSFVTRYLSSQFPDVQIVMIDNLLTQRFPSLFDMPTGSKFRFIEGNVIEMNMQDLVDKGDVVIHLAAITDAAGSFDKAEELEANNFHATRTVAELCSEKRARLITLSSTSVYGTQNEIVSEDCSVDELKPQSPYAVTKLREEEFVTNLCKTRNLRAVICRFGTIFGTSAGMRFHTAVNKFCWQAVMRQPITVWKTAFDQKRPYLDLSDAAKAFEHIIQKDIFDSRVYNILTMNATVRTIIDSIGKYIPDLNIHFVDNKIMNQLSYEVSCERFMSTGFVFQGDLDKGIGETVTKLAGANSLSI